MSRLPPTYSATQAFGRAIDSRLNRIAAYKPRPGESYPIKPPSGICAILCVVSETKFTRRELETWQRRFRRWLKHDALKVCPRQFNLPGMFMEAQTLMAVRLLRARR